MPPHCMSRVCIRVRGSYQAVIPFPRHGKGLQKLLRGARWHSARLGNGSLKLVKPPLSGHLSERDPREERCRRLTVPPQGRGQGQRLETNWLSLSLSANRKVDEDDDNQATNNNEYMGSTMASFWTFTVGSLCYCMPLLAL